MVAVTIVTVCFNEEKNIARTIESVLKQSTTDCEYIICDGLSKDRTVEIAESYYGAFAKKGISYRVYSEKDQGIYDAMNKGIAHAGGQYIYFLNAGDWFCEELVLERFVTSIRQDSTPAVIYANYYYVNNHRATLVVCDDAFLPERMSIGHPAMVARTDLMREERFDAEYRIAADYNFVLSLKLRGLQFKYLDFAATYFMGGGISSIAIDKTNEELRKIHESHGLLHEDAVLPPMSARQKLIHFIIDHAPTCLWRFWTKTIKHGQWVEY